ncbi:hypothetical protein WAJ29_21070, partial [Acinetobacter baumannii]
PNLGMAFVSLKHWNKRKGEANTASAIRERAQSYLQKNLPAKVMVGMPASVSGLGQSDALELWLRDVNGQGRNELIKQYKALEN